jgi:signal transduction histidine kinase/DNA-binding response OmpR family regulator
VSTARTRILVVDDRRDQLVTLQAVMDDLVDEIVCASSGREALRILLDPREFAVMLLDIQMPAMDGFELAEMIRQHKVHRQTPIIFVTASSDDLHVQRCYALGAVDYILTPVVPTVLRAKVSVLVELHKKTLQVRRQAEVLRRRATQLHSLTNASLGIHAAGSLPDILRAVAEAAQSIVGALSVVAKAAPAGEQAPPHMTVMRPAGSGDDASVARSMARLEAFVRDRGASVRFTKAEIAGAEEWRAGPGDDPMPLDSYMGAPLAWSDGQSLGVLQVSGKAGGGDFDADDEAVIAHLAHVASIAIQNRVLGDAREANRLKDEFFTNLSHELRNPLNAVVGWVQFLQKMQTMPVADDGRERALAALERNTSLLTRLVDDLLDASRVVSKRMTLQTRPMGLEEVIRSTVESLRVAAEAKAIRLEARVPSHAVEVLGDAQRLTQAVWNLVANAIKFTPTEGRVTVDVLREGADAVVVVEDDGEGIAPDLLPYVFDRFRQGRPSTHRGTGGGLGLGLAIVRAVVELHGGTVSAHSDGAGRGARFTMRLPPLASSVDLDGYHVLLIERDAGARGRLEGAFSGLGARVTAVAEAGQAIDALGVSRPHVLVASATDLGDDTLRSLRGTMHSRELPVLALTDGEVAGGWHLGDLQPMLAPRTSEPGAIARAIRSMVAGPPAPRPPPQA